MKKVIFNIMILAVTLIGGFLAGQQTAKAQDVDATITNVQGDTLTAQDSQGNTYTFDRAEDDTDPWNKGDKITLDVATEQKPRGEHFFITNQYTQEDGDIITEYNNSSWSLENDAKGKFEFCPSELGDWSYNLEHKEDLNNIIATYKSIYENGNF
jgi:uncharacterized protein YegJ (DUF2314 family)